MDHPIFHDSGTNESIVIFFNFLFQLTSKWSKTHQRSRTGTPPLDFLDKTFESYNPERFKTPTNCARYRRAVCFMSFRLHESHSPLIRGYGEEESHRAP